jgi:hypothetical protein
VNATKTRLNALILRSRVELVINPKTAKDLDLAVSNPTQLLADDVISPTMQ